MVAKTKSVSSRDNPLWARLRKLAADPGGYRRQGEVWIEGDHLCRAFAQHGGSALQAVISEAAWDENATLRDLADHAAAIAVVPQALLHAVSGLESPSSIGFIVPWAGAGTLLAGEPSVVLDRLQDAGNVGTILRSASAFGFTQVVALKGTAALWSPKVLRAGMGAHFGLRLVEGLDSLGDIGTPLLASSPHAAQSPHEVVLPWPCAWVMGHEGQGVEASLMQRCQQVLRIPQPGGEESLNVAAATAVCLYESVRQRMAPLSAHT
jgi:TrmH family RNA methyltransferase